MIGARRTLGLGLISALFLVVLLSLLPLACSHGPVPPPKDPTKGEFYTPEETMRLPAGERDHYCQYLESTLKDLRAETVRLNKRLDSLGVESDSLRNRSIRINAETRDLNAVVRDLRLKDKAVRSYIVKEGDNLRGISQIIFGDPTRWKEIYETNKGVIGAEDAPLKAGTRLNIPGGTTPVPTVK